MTVVVGGSSPQITFADSTVQNTAFTGLNQSATPYTTSLGYQAANSTTGVNVTAIGYQAGYTNTTGANLTFIGYKVGYSNTTGSYNVFVGGYDASTQPTGGLNTTGQYNVAVGSGSLASNTTANANTAIGYQAAYSNTTGSGCVAIGSAALYTNSTSGNNIAIGPQAGYLTTGSNNTIVGYQAGYSIGAGSHNSVFGWAAYNNISNTGSYNCAFGEQSLYNNQASNNTAVGYQAGYNVTTGGSNIFLGFNAGTGQVNGYGVSTASNSIYIGQQVGSGVSGGANHEAVITTNGYAYGKGANTFFVYANSSGSGAVGGSYYNGANSNVWQTTSDQRLKKNIVTNTDGLNKISQLLVRNFEYRLPSEVDPSLKPTDAVNKTGVQLGFIAQELQTVLPDCVTTEESGVMSINIDNIIFHMVTSIQQLNTLVTTQATEIAALKAKVGI